MPITYFLTKPVRLEGITALAHFWDDGRVWSYEARPRPKSGLFCLDGCSAEYEWDGRTLCCPDRSIVFIPENARYRVTFHTSRRRKDRPNSSQINFHLIGEAGSDSPGFDPFPSILTEDAAGTIIPRMHELAVLFANPAVPPLLLQKEAYDILWETAALCRSQMPRDIVAIMRCFEEHPEAISEPELAARCGVSVPTLIRTVRRYFGTTPSAYLLDKRIAKAKELLRDGMHTVSEVSELLGFSSPAYFSSVFRKQTGVSPSAYISKAGK